MQFVCLIYFDPKDVFNQSPEANAVLAEVGPHAAALRDSGHLIANQALGLPRDAVTLRVRGGRVAATDGPFMETKEMLGGFIQIEAADMSEALEIAAKIPFARLGAVEVRPVPDFSKPRPVL